jgi:2,3-bisphosphoglycerate-independent phosphoglycerate mutase
MNNEGIIMSGGTISAGQIAVGKNAKIIIDQRQLTKSPNEYMKSLQAFSEAINAQLKEHNISQEKAAPVQESINELVKEVGSIKPEEKINIERKEEIKARITKIAIRLLNILPEGAEVLTAFTPLAPFSKIIGKRIEEIVDAIKEEI